MMRRSMRALRVAEHLPVPTGWPRRLTCLFALAAVVATGCREADPPTPHNRDLGTNARPLLPTGSTWKNPAVGSGQAEWYPFREPDVAEPPDTAQEIEDEPEQQDNEEFAAEIREIIEDYNDLLPEATADDLLEYFVEGQHEALKPWFETAIGLAPKLVELREQLEAKAPEATERIAAAFAALDASAGPELAPGSITSVGDAEAKVTVTRGFVGATCTLRIIDDEWYIEVPDTGSVSELKSVLDGLLAASDGWLEGLESGQTTAEQVIEQLESAAEAAKTTRGVAASDEMTAPADAAETGASDEGGDAVEPPET